MWGKVRSLYSAFLILRFNPTCVGKRVAQFDRIQLRSVQPHVCGEKFSARDNDTRQFGSTPRVWGKDRVRSDHVEIFRFNPTCVGKRSLHRFRSLYSAVQPHVCGEKLMETTHKILSFGSTPRVWGKVKLSHLQLVLQRFNPTCVGKRYFDLSILRRPSVQPHVCGEKSLLSSNEPRRFGSTPRVWGKA